MVINLRMPSKKRSIETLVEIMARLRSPDGCPWDKEQDHQTIKQCLIEEAYEVIEAIESNDKDTLCDELGDLLLQVVFHAQMAKEKGEFDFDDVVGRLSEKLIRRHPHIFGDKNLADSDAVLKQWDKIKQEERKKAGKPEHSLLDGVPGHLPALIRAEKLQKKAAKAGFGSTVSRVMMKIRHDLHALQRKLIRAKIRLVITKAGKAKPREIPVEEVLGDLLFAVADVAHHLKLEPEQLLRDANKRFEKNIRARHAG